MKKNPIETGLVIISNLFPFYGLFFLGWSPFNTVMLFLIETLFILAFLWLRTILRAFNGIYSNILPSIFITIPVMVFSIAQMLLSTIMFATSGNSLMWVEIDSILTNAATVTYVGIIFIFFRELAGLLNFIKNKRYKLSDINSVKANYKSLGVRIILMQFIVIVGGVVSKMTNNPAIGVSLLILIVATINIKSYFRS